MFRSHTGSFIRSLFVCGVLVSPLFCAEDVLFLGKLPNPHEYVLFATSGWNGNWYLGPDHCWIQKFRAEGNGASYDRVYAGARLGRARRREDILELLGYNQLRRDYGEKEKALLSLKGENLQAAKDELAGMTNQMEEIMKKVDGPHRFFIAVSTSLGSWKEESVFEFVSFKILPIITVGSKPASIKIFATIPVVVVLP